MNVHLRRSYSLFLLPFALAACADPGADAQAATHAVAVDAQPVNAVAAPQSADVTAPVVHVYKSPTCGCCKAWVAHLEENGFRTEVEDMPNVDPVKQKLGVPGHLASCHTGVVNGYVIEGHVPADVIRRLLAEKPAVAGLAVPGMPMGSPGMEGLRKEAYDVVAFGKDGSQSVYESR